MLQYLSQEDQKWVQETLQKVTEKMEIVRERAQKKIPFTSMGSMMIIRERRKSTGGPMDSGEA